MRKPARWELVRALELVEAGTWTGGSAEDGHRDALPLTAHDLTVAVPTLLKALKEMDATEAAKEEAMEETKSAARRGRPPKVDALSQAAHQARHKERLRAAGLTETKVRVRAGQEGIMRAIAAALVGGALTEAQLRALLEPRPVKPARKPRAKLAADADLAPDPGQVTLYEVIEAAKARCEQGEG